MGVGTRLLGTSALAAACLSSAMPGVVAVPAAAVPTASSGPRGAAVVGAGSVPVAAGARAGGLSWHPCASGYRCASLAVPVDYADPQEGTLKLALIELPATGRHVVGDLVMNPGGPGASGLEFLQEVSFPAGLRASFNLVSFDPRGVGQSDPVTCVGAAGIRSLVSLNPDPKTPAQVATVVRATQAFDQACAKHTSAQLLRNVSTLDEARDL